MYAECPYCEAEQYPDYTDFDLNDETTKHEYQCDDCGQFFLLSFSLHISYDTEPCDCLNTGAHDYETREATVSNTKYVWQHCRQCGAETSSEKVQEETSTTSP